MYVHKVGVEITKIKEEIANLARNLEAYGINHIIETQPSVEEIQKRRRLRMTYAHEVQEHFVGMEEDVINLVAWTLEETSVRSVISICGIGGLGKTTLARKVFYHKEVQDYFDAFAWVCIAQECHIKSTLQDILIQIIGDKGSDNIRGMEETEIVRMLIEVQKEKKCLVILDDIWKLTDWKSLCHAFPITDSSSKSKILLTTRNTEVADVARSSQHKPSYLSEQDAWKLLTMIAFGPHEDQGQGFPQMVRKCDGLPLAISVLGGILRNKDPLTEWDLVNKNIDKYLVKRNDIKSVLAMSYDDLPPYLRSCFLCMGCFPEDEDISAEKLYYKNMELFLLTIIVDWCNYIELLYNRIYPSGGLY